MMRPMLKSNSPIALSPILTQDSDARSTDGQGRRFSPMPPKNGYPIGASHIFSRLGHSRAGHVGKIG
jgi:hypothetical protein